MYSRVWLNGRRSLFQSKLLYVKSRIEVDGIEVVLSVVAILRVRAALLVRADFRSIALA